MMILIVRVLQNAYKILRRYQVALANLLLAGIIVTNLLLPVGYQLLIILKLRNLDTL
jgi:hypothetical protein